MDSKLRALTSTAAATVVQLLATAAWEQATTAMDGLWRRVYPERVETVHAELKEIRAEVLAARWVGDEEVERALVGEWQGRLRRLVAADPQLAGELQGVVATLREVLADADPHLGTTITQRVMTVSKGRDNQVGHDRHVATGK